MGECIPPRQSDDSGWPAKASTAHFCVASGKNKCASVRPDQAKARMPRRRRATRGPSGGRADKSVVLIVRCMMRVRKLESVVRTARSPQIDVVRHLVAPSQHQKMRGIGAVEREAAAERGVEVPLPHHVDGSGRGGLAPAGVHGHAGMSCAVRAPPAFPHLDHEVVDGQLEATEVAQPLKAFASVAASISRSSPSSSGATAVGAGSKPTVNEQGLANESDVPSFLRKWALSQGAASRGGAHSSSACRERLTA